MAAPPYSDEQLNDLRERIKAAYGSPEQMAASILGRMQDFQALWEKDSKEIGEVLHAHIIVEHCLSRYLEGSYPEIDFNELPLSYERKVQMIPKTSAHIRPAVPGLKALGRIRNKLAHRIDGSLTVGAVQSMVQCLPYRLFVVHAAAIDRLDLNAATPLQITLSFSKWIGGCLELLSDDKHGLFRDTINANWAARAQLAEEQLRAAGA